MVLFIPECGADTYVSPVLCILPTRSQPPSAHPGMRALPFLAARESQIGCGTCNRTYCLVLPFRLGLIRSAAPHRQRPPRQPLGPCRLTEIRRCPVLPTSLKLISKASLLLCDNRGTGNAGETKHPLIALNLIAAAQRFFKVV